MTAGARGGANKPGYSEQIIEDFDLLDRAIGYAAKAHRKQRRKVGSVPYIAHPMGVVLILQSQGVRTTVLAAAMLHDTVEDTAATLDDIAVRFGSEVADIVAGCTEIRGPWERRKLEMIERLKSAPAEVKLVVAADKYHNLRHIRRSWDSRGKEMWRNFSRGAEQQAWYYRSMLESLFGDGALVLRYPLFDHLAAAIDEIFGEIESQAP